MKTKITPGVFAALFLGLASSLWGASLEGLIGPEAAAELRAGKTLTGVQLKNPAPLLAPAHAAFRSLLEENMKTLEPGILVEALARYKKPEKAEPWTLAERNALFNEAMALSSLEGIQYYSASRKTMRTFYESSRVIDGPETRRVLPDPFYPNPPARLSLYARQKDLTFGENIYRYDYRAGEDFLIFVQENLSPMNAGIIPALGKNKLRSLVAVIDTEDSLLVYVASLAKAAAIPGIGGRIGSSFTNRAEAILKWFAGRADRVFSGA
ncbi:MAG: hypothetical protein LBH26_04275 [Treponema sp.]|jgi:hypothetical protein|nr:hypothetical protein [Treponema sp.]